MFRPNENKLVTEPITNAEELRVRKGDILMSRANTRDLVGSVARIDLDPTKLLLCDKLYRLVPRSNLVDSGFLVWLLQSRLARSQIECEATGASGSMQNIGQDTVRRLTFAWPPLQRQQRIARLLDERTAHTDALIDRKERLLGLLEEKRQALITRAVTRGLDPDAPTKPSGIEWIGDVPVHWDVTRLRFISPSITVGIVVTPSKYYVEEGVPCPRGLNVRPFEVDLANAVFISPEANALHRKSIIHAGDLLCVRTGKPGATAVVPDSLDGANCIDLVIVRRSDRAESNYLCYLMNSEMAQAQYTMGSEGALQQHFNVETAKDLRFPLPPLPEQRQIATYLDAELAHLSSLRAKLTRSIELLREYRQALITAAVTGKLDLSDAA